MKENFIQTEFIQIPKLKDKEFIMCASGEFHSLALSKNNEIFGWGSIEFGKLSVKSNFSYGKNKKKFILEPENIFKEFSYFQTGKIKSIACGVNHSSFVNNYGDCFTWGSALSGKLGITKEKIILRIEKYDGNEIGDNYYIRFPLKIQFETNKSNISLIFLIIKFLFKSITYNKFNCILSKFLNNINYFYPRKKFFRFAKKKKNCD